MKIIAVYDNDETIDRYTIVFDEVANSSGMLEMLALSSNPDSSQGFSQWTCGEDGDHLGSKLEFSDLPQNIQDHINRRLKA